MSCRSDGEKRKDRRGVGLVVADSRLIRYSGSIHGSRRGTVSLSDLGLEYSSNGERIYMCLSSQIVADSVTKQKNLYSQVTPTKIRFDVAGGMLLDCGIKMR